MTRSERLQPIANYKDQQQKKCLQDMANSRMQWEQHQQQLENLKDYQKEYQNKQAGVKQMPQSAMQLVEFSRFMDQLENTIKQQGLVVLQAERDYQMKQRHWLKMKNNAKAVEHLVENIQNEEIKHENLQEQKLLDEFGLRLKST